MVHKTSGMSIKRYVEFRLVKVSKEGNPDEKILMSNGS